MCMQHQHIAKSHTNMCPICHACAEQELSFGAVFTDHMLLIEQSDSTGWGRPRIQPFAPLQLHPATQVGVGGGESVLC